MKFSLPDPPCPECGSEHSNDIPHNWGSEQYRAFIQKKHGREPTMKDAFAHIPARKRKFLIRELRKFGLGKSA